MRKTGKFFVLLAVAALLIGVIGATFISAADDTIDGKLIFLVGNEELPDGSTIDYSLYNQEDSTITIRLRIPSGIEAGTKFNWGVSNSNIIRVKSQDDTTGSVTLDIISPGFSGLSVDIEMGGKLYPAAAYVSIYVPLQWSDNVSTTKEILNNIKGTAANGYYGYIVAQDGDSNTDPKLNNYTVQLYTSDSADHPEASHYLRKLRYVKYAYVADDPNTAEDETTLQSVRSDIEASQLGPFTAALEWSSTNPSVAEVDSLTGLVTAKSAGFTTISVQTSTENEKLGKRDTLSYDVFVIPEAYVTGNSTSSRNTGVLNPYKDSTITFQTNAKYANSLQWRVFKGEGISESSEIEKPELTASDSNGRVVIENLKAGVYYVTAVPIKDKDKATETGQYEVIGKKDELLALEYVVVVPVKWPADSITLSYYNSNIYDSYDLMTNSNLPEDIFRFSVKEGTNTARVNSNTGVVDATGEGEAKVSITPKNAEKLRKLYGDYYEFPESLGYDHNTFTEKITTVIVYDGIAINTSSATMTLGSEMQLSLTAPSPYNGELYWSSADKSICSVDESGLVKANKVGETIVTVQIVVGSGVTKRAQCAIKVVASVGSIKLTAISDRLKKDDSLTINAEINPKLSDAQLKWTSSDPKVAEITYAGPITANIKGLSTGTTVITAVNPDNGIVGTMLIHVISDISAITLSDKEVVIPKSAGFYQLYATCTPELPDNEKLTWKSTDEKVIKVDQNGKVSIVKPGTANIIVLTSNGKDAVCKFTILQGMESISLDESTLTMFVGDTYRMAYIISPETVSDKTLKWTSTDPKVVTVDATGFFTAKNTGNCVITAQAQDGTGVFTTCTVTVLRNATGISMDVKDLTLNVGENYILETLLKPSDSTDTIKYESNNTKVATVSVTGKITAKAKGSCVIFATTEAGVSTYCNVTVTQQVTGIKVSPATLTMYVGDTYELVSTITPKNASDPSVKWSSNDAKVVSVDDNGMIKALKGGSTIVKCITEDGDFMAYSLITVVEKVTSVTVDNYVEIAVGKKLQLNATVSGETATNKNVKWASSNKKIVKVSKKGVIKGVKAGNAVIRVKAADGSGAYADCEVRVIRATNSIDLSATYVELMQGERVRLKATTTPAKVTYPLIWTSDNEKVAVVNKKGKITALKAGDCIIKCTSGDNPDVYEVCYVHITSPVAISSISLAEESVVMVPGESTAVQYTIQPANYTESFGWSSDNPSVATVNSNGRITAKNVGTATVTVMSKSGKKSTIKVYVVGLSKSKITLHQYESTKINLQLDGVGSNKLDVRWDTDNQSIAEIANGKVTGRALGTTTVYCIVNGRYLACTVKVIKN